MRVSSLGVKHLLGVSVIGRHTQDIAGLLASIVNGLDSLVGSSDGNDGGIIHTGVANLILVQRMMRFFDLPYQEEQNCT